MKQTSSTHPNKTGEPSAYEHLLAAAQAAQSAADRAVADLAAIKRTLAEAPRITQLRREELARAQQALDRAEADLAQAREQVAGRQMEAARLIEAAAEAQRALAQALIKQDIIPDQATLDVLAARQAPAAARPAQASARSPAQSSFDATLGANRYTPTPLMHPADLHTEVVDYLKDRDALCPSCGHRLRGITTARCPGCKLQLSVNVLRSVRASPLEATASIWTLRILGIFGLLMSAYLALVVIARSKPFGCGVGSTCHAVFRSGWSKLVGIPVAALALPLFFAVIVATGFIRIGLKDDTRRRAWSIITVCGLALGLGGIWFSVVQFAFIQAVCPHCLAVNLAAVVIAAIVMLKAPLNRPESLPERATGPITIAGNKVGVLAAVAAGLVTMVAAAQVATVDRRYDDERIRVQNQPPQPEDGDGGLLMKGLDIGTRPEKPPIKPEEAPETPSPKPPAPDPAAPAPTPTPAPVPAPAIDKPTTPEKSNVGSDGLLLPGLNLREKPAVPEKKDAKPGDGKSQEEKNGSDATTKEPATINFNETLPAKPAESKSK